MAIVRYAGNRMTGVSGDTKPTEGSLITGTTFHETNTDDLYIWDGDSWNVVASNTVAETLSSKTLTSPVINTGLSGSAFLDEDNFASDSATKVASQQSIKAYVASQIPGSQNVFSTLAVSGQDNVVADGSTDTLTLVASTNMTITTTAGSDTITFASAGSTTLDGLTDTDVGSLSSAHILIYDGSNSWDNKAVSGDVTIASTGAVTIAANAVEGTMLNANTVDDSSIELASNTLNIKATGVTNAMLAGSIANGKLTNSSITVSDGSNTSPVSLGGTLTFAATANETTVAESAGTVTIGLPNNVTIAGNLIVTGNSTVNGNITTHGDVYVSGDVGIGVNSPVATAALEVVSTTKSFLPPRMTTTQRNAISSPATGSVIYNTSTNLLNHYNGSAWLAVGAVAAGASQTVEFSDALGGTQTIVILNGLITSWTS